MNTMKRIAFLAALAAAVFSFGRPASALEVRVANDFDKKMFFALVYHDSDAGKWRTRGWFAAEPHKTRTITLKSSKDKAYIYAEAGGSSWGKGAVSRTVIDKPFSYFDGEKCPAGKGRKTVQFTECQANSKGIVSYRPVSAKPAQAQPAAPKKPSGTRASPAVEIVRLTNAERSKRNLSALKIDDALTRAAQKRAEECAVKYGHTRLDGSSYYTVFEEFGTSYQRTGENIQYSQPDGISASKAVAGWMNSESHREAILTREFTHIGVAVYSKGNRHYYVQEFAQK